MFVLFVLPLLFLGSWILGIYLACLWLRGRWVRVGSGHPGKRLAIVLAGCLAICWPYLLLKGFELRFVLARVPEPLHVSWIEYRQEQASGFGLPGDAESGFVVYRLTTGSAEWARNQTQNLIARLPGGSEEWRATPVDDQGAHSPGHAHHHDRSETDHRANLREYLDGTGFSIALEEGRDIEFNEAIRNPGSFYAYGRGGTITVVDPKRGKVYFAYAG